MGYRLAAGLFTAAEVGAPHKRERLFILAIRENDDLADPARLLWHPVEWREPNGTAAALADAPRQRQREPADETHAVTGSGPARHEPRDDGRDVADADGKRWVQAECGQPPRSRPDPCDGDVDDADSAGSQGRADDTFGHPGERLVWPPGPGDADGWERYLRAAPNLEPLFVEALMGWPTGWTGFASVAMAWSPWLRRMRCELWQLNCWPMDEAAT